MKPIISFTVAGVQETIAKLNEIPGKLRSQLLKLIYSLVLQVQTKVVQGHLSGPTGATTLSRISGKLARSVHASVSETSFGIIGKIFYTGDVPYAAIHEFGGVITAHDIFPNKADVLHFMMGGKEIFAASVHIPNVKMPERAPLRTGFAEMKDTVIEEINDVTRVTVKI